MLQEAGGVGQEAGGRRQETGDRRQEEGGRRVQEAVRCRRRSKTFPSRPVAGGGWKYHSMLEHDGTKLSQVQGIHF